MRNAIHRLGVHWDEVLEELAASHNFSPTSFCDYSPYFLNHMRHPRLPQDVKALRGTAGDMIDGQAILRMPKLDECGRL